MSTQFSLSQKEKFAKLVEQARQIDIAKRFPRLSLVREGAVETIDFNATIADNKQATRIEPTVEAIREEIKDLITIRLPQSANILEGELIERKEWIWNEEQQRAIDLGVAGESFVLIGAAGTGKTTLVKEIFKRLLQRGKIAPLEESTKWLVEGRPGAVVLSFTNKAVANIAKGMPRDITCLTAHKLVEFAPIFFEIQNAQGDWVKTMRFEPGKNEINQLPESLNTIFFEESSTINLPLHAQVMVSIAAQNPQIVYLGDIQQLPPVFGSAILGFKMLDLPVVELTKVMRQAEDSPILAFAWKILEGKPMSPAFIKDRFNSEGKFGYTPWKKPMDVFNRNHVINLLMNRFLENGEYNPNEDMILLPHGKRDAVSSYEVNKHLANVLGKARKAIVHEVIAGFQKFYFAVGDKVMVNKQEAIIERIARNADYRGVSPIPESEFLNRWGQYEVENAEQKASLHHIEMTLEEMEALMLQSSISSEDVEERKNQGSHILHCRYIDFLEGETQGEEVEVQTTGEYMECLFGYALTIYKSQGSEWKKVFLFLDRSHNKAICRELLYTAVTRAKQQLWIFAEPDHFEKGIQRQRIKGDTLAEKAEWFKGKREDLEIQKQLKLSTTVEQTDEDENE